MSIDWLGTPLHEFLIGWEKQESGLNNAYYYPHGKGEAQHLMIQLSGEVEKAYAKLMGPEDYERFETEGVVPVIRSGQRGYEDVEGFTLSDLPMVLETLVVLEVEHEQRQREESERKKAERRERERVRSKERRKLKKLGEW